MKYISVIIILFLSLQLKAQEYPKLYSKDKKLYLITESQLRSTIKLNNEVFMCDEKLELYKSLYNISKERSSALSEKIYLYEDNISKFKLIIEQKDVQLGLKDKIIKEQKSQLRTQKRKKIAGGTIGFGLGVIAGVITTTYLIR
jgi:hypothetical protein